MTEKAGMYGKTPEAKQTCPSSCKQKPGFNSSGSTANKILQLQKTAGNQAVQKLIKSRALQAKLKISQPNDIYEQEADRIAEQVMRMPEPAIQKKQKCSLRSDAACNEDKIDRQVGMRKDAGDRTRQFSPQDYILFRQQVPTKTKQSTTPGSYDENSVPIFALPLMHRLVYIKTNDTGFYYDRTTIRTYSQEELEDYSIGAQNQIALYKKLVIILSRKLDELQNNPSCLLPGKMTFEYIHESFIEAENKSFKVTEDKTGGYTQCENPNQFDFSHVKMSKPEENPFFIFPFWEHERSHQKTCLTTIQSYMNQGLNEQAAKVKVADEYRFDPIFLIKDEIKSYNIAIKEIQKELDAFKNGFIEITAKNQMNLPETFSIHRNAAIEQNNSILYPHMSALADINDVLQSSGQPLDTQTRAFFEPRFGYDFSDVRVHTDPKAAESARAVNALAYTVGKDIAFEEGQYTPGNISGEKLLAHELTHVIQQKNAYKSPIVQSWTADSNKFISGIQFVPQKIQRQVINENESHLKGKACTEPKKILKEHSGIQWTQGLVFDMFTIEINWTNKGPFCNCGCGEYRQYVNGHVKVNGKNAEKKLFNEARLDEEKPHEDADKDGKPFGHRDFKGESDDEFFSNNLKEADRQNACSYRGKDMPGIPIYIGDYLDMHLTFTGMVYDRCKKTYDKTEKWESKYIGDVL
jgi:hypothetical protein